jgi:cytidylate kinase
MDKKEKFVITINRELGSGGRTVGRLLAEKLGVPFYDKAVIKALQERYNLTVEEVEKLKGRKHSWWADVERILKIDSGMNMENYMPNRTDAPDLLTTDEMFKTETMILQDLAVERSCVVAGRSGFHVFRMHPNHLSVLIQASTDYRVERVARKQNMTPEEALKTIEQVDKMRENYVKKYTGTSRYDTRNYQLVITADGKTEEEMADLIMQYIGGE